MIRNVAWRLFIGLLVTALSAKAGARLTEMIATNAFGSLHTIQVQWTVALVIGAIGLLATYYNVKEAYLSRTKGQT